MDMIVDMINTVTVITRAAGTVTKLEIRILGVRASTDGTLVTIGFFTSLIAVIGGPVGVGGYGFRGVVSYLAVSHSLRQQIAEAGTIKQKIVQHCDDREEPSQVYGAIAQALEHGNDSANEADQRHAQIEPGEVLCSDRDDKEQKEANLRQQSRNGKEQSEVEIVD